MGDEAWSIRKTATQLRRALSAGWSERLSLVLMFVVVLGVGLMVAVLSAHTAVTDQGLAKVEQELQLRSQLAAFAADLQDIESSKRGYIITGNAGLLVPIDAAAARVGVRLEWLFEHSRGNPDDEAALHGISKRLGHRLLALEHAVEAARNSGIESARSLVVADAVDGEMGEILLAERGMAERSQLRGAAARSEIARRTRWVQGAMIGIMACTLAAFVTLVVTVRRSLRLRDRAADQLAAAKRVAETANRAKSDFLAAMSHELRTPLNAILGFSEIIRDRLVGDGKPEVYSDYARDIHHSGSHLLGLIDDILDLSKAEAGQTRLSCREVDVGRVVAACLDMVAVPARKAGLDLAVEIELRDAGAVPVVRADELRVRQILLNLLSNAIKFTLPGGAVRLRAGWTATELVLRVEDTGVGIDAADLPFVFVPFGRIESRLARPGNGLGLSIVKNMAEAHGGTVRLTSAVGQGTEVEVRLPLAGPPGAGAPLRTGATACAAVLGLCLALGSGPAAAAGAATVVHWWTSPSEAAAVRQLIQAFTATGNRWVDSPVVGNGNARTMVRAEIFSDEPPTAAQWVLGTEIRRLLQAGLLQPVQRPQWDAVLPAAVRDRIRTDAGYAAVPLVIHSRSTLWLNRAIFDRLGLQPPRTWDEFDRAAEAIRAAGIVPLAWSTESWQDYLVFESVVAGVGGPQFYRQALLELDDAALASPTMIEVFARMRRLGGDAAPLLGARTWDAATGLVATGQAAMQIMGSWAEGEFVQAGRRLGTDFDCLPAPGTGGLAIFNASLFLLLKNRDPAQRPVQEAFADMVMDPAVQSRFAAVKGEPPMRRDASLAGLDRCMLDTARAAATPGALLPATEVELPDDLRFAIEEVVAQALHYDLNPADSVALLRRTVAAHR